MPTNRTRRRPQRIGSGFTLDDLSLLDMLNLSCGHFGHHNTSTERIVDEDTLRQAWEANRDVMMEIRQPGFAGACDGREAGTMPACWWKFDAPEPRLVIGRIPFVAPPWGVRCLNDADVLQDFKAGEVVRWDDHEESESTFLIRHGLMDDDERRMVATKNAAKRSHLAAIETCCCSIHLDAEELMRLEPIAKPTADQRKAWRIEQQLLREILG